VVIRIQEYHDKDYFQVEYYFDKLKERSTRKIVILALFDFFTQKAVPFTHKTYVYIAEIDSERYIFKRSGHKINRRKQIYEDDTYRYNYKFIFFVKINKNKESNAY